VTDSTEDVLFVKTQHDDGVIDSTEGRAIENLRDDEL
jgi:hypothetical protein